MLRILCVLFLFLFTGCPKNTPVIPSEPDSAQVNYMTKEQVIQAYLKMNVKEVAFKNEPYTKEELERLSNMPKLDVFFPKETMKKLNQEKMVEANTTAIKTDVDLREYATPIKNQDDGKCTGYSGTAGIEMMINKTKKIIGLDLSEWHIWSKYNQYSCDAFLNAAINKGYICDEKYFPQYGKQSLDCEKTAHAKLVSAPYIGNDINAIMQANSNGNVVYFATTTPSDMLKCPKVINPYTTFENSGHALLIVGYYTDPRLDTPLVILRNSWGTSCGDKGYQILPWKVCLNGGNCVAWEFKSVENK